MAKILVIDDDIALSTHVRDWLVSVNQHTVEVAHSAEDGFQLLTQFAYELLILDWQLPGISGLELCGKIRAKQIPLVILFLTGQDETKHLEAGFDAGADDYLKKPFELRELSARIKALLRRSAIITPLTFASFALSLELDKRILKVGDEEVKLTKLESAFLDFLMRHPDATFGAADILKNVYPSEKNSSEEAVRAMVKGLRTKLAQVGNQAIASTLIKTTPGLGYSFTLPSSPPPQSK